MSILGIFVFPWKFTLLLTTVVSFYVPVFALLMGIFYELLYGTGLHIPYVFLWCVAIFITTKFVRYIIKTRII
jgi:hypothetical protein